MYHSIKIQNILEHLKEVNLETYTGCRFSPFKYWFTVCSFTAFFPGKMIMV